MAVSERVRTLIEALHDPCSNEERWEIAQNAINDAVEEAERNRVNEYIQLWRGKCGHHWKNESCLDVPCPICSLLEYVRDDSSEPCEYGDSCPGEGTRHGMCRPCRARRQLDWVKGV